MSKAIIRVGVPIFLAFFVAGIFVFYQNHQPVITYENCKLCDGNQYLAMYQYLEGTTKDYNAAFPYYSRIIVPALASLLPGQDALQAFHYVNLCFSILSVLALYFLWRRLNLSWLFISLGFFWLLFHWTGMIRLNIFDPVTVDMPLYFIQTLLILIFLNKNYKWLLLLGPVAVLQKESITVLLLAFFVFALWHNRYFKDDKIPLKWLISAIILTILTKSIFTWFYPPLQEGYSSVRLVLFYLKEILLDPFRLIRWITGVFTAYGFFWILAVFRLTKNNLQERTFSFLTFMSVISVLLSVIGGQDHTRIAFLGFPFVMTCILILIKDVSWKWLALTLLFSLPFMRILEKIPDPGQDFSNFASWYPEFAPAPLVTGLTGFLALISLLFVAIHLTEKEKG